MNELAASEGIFTSAQARRLGITAKALSQAAAAGRAERLVHGAYRLAGAAASEYDELAAIWKLIEPARFTHERMATWDGIAIGGTTAANMLAIGDFWLSPYRIYAPRRINSRLGNVRFSRRRIDNEDIVWLHSLPITKMERTLVDLCLDFEDPSLISDALADAARSGLDFHRLADIIGQQSKRAAAAKLLAHLSERAKAIREERAT